MFNLRIGDIVDVLFSDGYVMIDWLLIYFIEFWNWKDAKYHYKNRLMISTLRSSKPSFAFTAIYLLHVYNVMMYASYTTYAWPIVEKTAWKKFSTLFKKEVVHELIGFFNETFNSLNFRF